MEQLKNDFRMANQTNLKEKVEWERQSCRKASQEETYHHEIKAWNLSPYEEAVP